MYLAAYRFWDPLYGLYELSPFERRFAFSPEVQRLRHVRLCNIDSLLIPGAAQVFRFEHTLGVLRLANEWISNHSVLPDEANDLRVAALIHDIQTGPFGHSIQYILEDNPNGSEFKHQDLAEGGAQNYHQSLRANQSYAGVPFQVRSLCGDRWESISKLINGETVLGRLISGSMDLDNIDNVIRLAFHVGLCDQTESRTALELARNMVPSAKGLLLSAQALPAISRWQKVRERLYQFLLLDWAEFSAKAMLTRAFEDAVLLEKVGTDNWRMTDEELIQYFLSFVGEAQGIKEIARRLRLGDLYSPLALVRSPSVEAYKAVNRIETKRKIEADIRKAISQSRMAPQVLVHFILDVRKTSRSVSVTIQETGVPTIIGSDSRSLLIGIFTSHSLGPADAASTQKELVQILNRYGCADLAPINDPLVDTPNRTDDQLTLFA